MEALWLTVGLLFGVCFSAIGLGCYQLKRISACEQAIDRGVRISQFLDPHGPGIQTCDIDISGNIRNMWARNQHGTSLI